MAFAKGTGFFDQLIRKSCPKCGCVDFSIRSISEDGKTIYVTCKKCGHDCYMTE